MRSPSVTHGRAKALRRRLSPPEVLLWARLRERRPDFPRFRRQHSISPYVADFYCSAARLVIEIDGGRYGEAAQALHDEARDIYMQRMGYRILRISSADVMAKDDEVAAAVVETALGIIRETFGARPRAPSVTAQEGAAPPPPQEGG